MPDEKAVPKGESVRVLRAVRDPNPFAGLGRAVSYLMTKPSFADRQFGNWSRTLTGQVNRGHYLLVSTETNIVGFAGWAFVNEDYAAAWLNGRSDPPSNECIDGDCMIINAWAADDGEINRFILKEVRKRAVGRKAAYAKRFYADGSVRPLRLTFTPALQNHAENSN
ncbi:MAG: toxin-activating lysine-acyltransferase [Parvularculaceae bacterium]|nr:toxin-activating lysine-acyltransferase [Parvularculaceae bacterium]